MSKKVTEELSDPYERIISEMIPPLLASKTPEETTWTITTAPWRTSSVTPLWLYFESAIDLSGYALQDLTFFPEMGFLQESPVRALANGAGVIESVMISSTPLNVEDVFIQLITGSTPALPEGATNLVTEAIDWSMLLYCRTSIHLLNNTIVSGAGFTTPIDATQTGSLSATAADKLFVYKFVMPLELVPTITDYTDLTSPACRVGLRGQMAEEPTLEYMMRLKRSYELANQV